MFDLPALLGEENVGKIGHISIDFYCNALDTWKNDDGTEALVVGNFLGALGGNIANAKGYDAEGNLLMAANREAYYPNLRYSSVNNKTSTFWRVNGGRVTLNRLTVAYKLPKNVCTILGAQSVRVNVTGQNLLSLYNPYPDNFIDPMMSYGVYPTLRKFTVGVNVTF